MTKHLGVLLLALLPALSACSDSSPGPLAGTWQAQGGVPMTLTFRSGETEGMGVIEHVDYKVEGQSVLVTYKDGMMKGSTLRMTMTSPDSMVAMGVRYKKVAQ
jgi:hypothetical protein